MDKIKNEWKKTTLTIKNIRNKNIDGTEELEIEVDDFEKTNLLLNELGYTYRSFQENKRKEYILDDVEIVIDSWPLIPDYVEIEGKNVQEVLKIAKLLGFSENETTTKDIESIYRDYGYDLNALKEIKLEGNRI